MATAAKTCITYREWLTRSSALLDYAISQIEQSRYCLNVIALNYPSLCNKYLEWGTVLASVQQAMAAQSLSLSMMARQSSKDTCARRMNLKRATVIYYQQLEVKND